VAKGLSLATKLDISDQVTVKASNLSTQGQNEGRATWSEVTQSSCVPPCSRPSPEPPPIVETVNSDDEYDKVDDSFGDDSDAEFLFGNLDQESNFVSSHPFDRGRDRTADDLEPESLFGTFDEGRASDSAHSFDPGRDPSSDTSAPDFMLDTLEEGRAFEPSQDYASGRDEHQFCTCDPLNNGKAAPFGSDDATHSVKHAWADDSSPAGSTFDEHRFESQDNAKLMYESRYHWYKAPPAPSVEPAFDSSDGFESDDESVVGPPVSVNAIKMGHGPTRDFPDVHIDGDDEHDEEIGADRGMIDTGTLVTCTGFRHLLHNYVEFTKDYPCPLRLLPASVGSDCTPVGVGYLRVPAANPIGYVDVRCYYTPQLRCTVIDERDFILASGIKPKQVYGEVILKDYEKGIFKYHAENKLKKSLDVVVYGILRNGKCYTHPFLPVADDARVEKLKELDPTFVRECRDAVNYRIYTKQEAELNE
jgi:hypothetical protein